MPVAQDWRMPGGTSDDMVSVGRAVVEALSALRSTLAGLTPIFTGLFTTTAAATIVVPNPNVTANSIIQLQAVNTTAGTLQGAANALYVDRAVTVPGVSFSVKTADGNPATASANFSYVIFNPAT